MCPVGTQPPAFKWELTIGTWISLWPLSKASHLWGLSPNLLHLPTDSKTHPCTPASLQIKTRVLRTKINPFPFSKTHLLPHVFPWISLYSTCSLTLGKSILTHIMQIRPSKPISCHFLYSCQLRFPGFTLNF